MQFVESKNLKPGMRIAKPIYNKMGVMLYERDTLLTPAGIKSIENFGLIGIFILEPAEPLPPLSEEDIQFEQFQTIYMFQIRFLRPQDEFYPEFKKFCGLCIQTRYQHSNFGYHDCKCDALYSLR